MHSSGPSQSLGSSGLKPLTSVEGNGGTPKPPPGGWDVTPQVALDPLGFSGVPEASGEAQTMPPRSLPFSSISGAPRSNTANLAQRVHNDVPSQERDGTLAPTDDGELHVPPTSGEKAKAQSWENELITQQALDVPHETRETAAIEGSDTPLASGSASPPQPLRIKSTHVDPKS